MRGTAALVVAAALFATGCNDDSSRSGKATPTTASARASSLACLQKSVKDPSLYSSRSDDGVEKGVRPLMTRGSKGGEILTGKLGAVVIEYPAELDAARAERRGRASRVLRQYVAPKRVTAIGRTLFIDYEHDPIVVKIVTAGAQRPERDPPTP